VSDPGDNGPGGPAREQNDDAFERLCAAVAAVPDPEVPVLTIADLGVLRGIERDDTGRVVVTITPTYSGCPAMQVMADEVQAVLDDAGVEGRVETVLHPAWTTAWMSEEGRAKLTGYGIAPPQRTLNSDGGVVVAIRRPVACPHCGATRTEVVSEFGSTACKALYRCLECREPFDYFKEL
jgi:ring-1,2-phenylacetyl-CoA epoxidase subunit PaaD